jgi:hypothetical protein
MRIIVFESAKSIALARPLTPFHNLFLMVDQKSKVASALALKKSTLNLITGSLVPHKTMTPEETVDKPICPESTIDSAPRRDFIRRAALVTASAGVGGILLGSEGKLLPRAAAKADGICYKCSALAVNTVFCGCNPKFAISGTLATSDSTLTAVAVGGYAQACCYPICSIPPCGPTGVLGEAVCGNGIVGIVCKGTGVWAITSHPEAIPLVARGGKCQVSPLQEWQNPSGTLSAVTAAGGLALGGISTCGFELRVNAPNQNGVQIEGPSSGIGAALVFQTTCTSGGPIQGWQILDTGSRASQGAHKLNIRNLNNSKDIFTICGPNCHVGIGVTSPQRVLCVNGRIHTQCGMGLGTQTINTTLAINGSISMKSRVVSATTTLSLSDYTVLANASSGAFKITLPSVASTAGACNGMILFVKKIDASANAVTIAAASTDTIEGNATIALKKQYDSLQLVSNNSSGAHEWYILQSAKCGVAVS